MRIDIAARTDVGCVRELNEDCFRLVRDLNLFVLSDGIGGHQHGEVASDMAVNAIAEHCSESVRNPSLAYEGATLPGVSEKTNRLASAVRTANRLIHEAATGNAELRGMGATVVAAWLDDQRLSLAHVGDSRAYQLRGEIFDALTQDHSLVAEQVRLGILTAEQAEQSHHQTMLMRALGAEEKVEVDVDEHLLLAGDWILLCSDGLSRMVSDPDMTRAIISSRDSETAVDRLVAMAKEAGGADNITVVLFRMGQRSSGFFRKFLPWRGR